MVTRELRDSIHHLQNAEQELEEESVLDVVDEFILLQIKETKDSLESLLRSFPEVFRNNY